MTSHLSKADQLVCVAAESRGAAAGTRPVACLSFNVLQCSNYLYQKYHILTATHEGQQESLVHPHGSKPKPKLNSSDTKLIDMA